MAGGARDEASPAGGTPAPAPAPVATGAQQLLARAAAFTAKFAAGIGISSISRVFSSAAGSATPGEKRPRGDDGSEHPSRPRGEQEKELPLASAGIGDGGEGERRLKVRQDRQQKQQLEEQQPRTPAVTFASGAQRYITPVRGLAPEIAALVMESVEKMNKLRDEVLEQREEYSRMLSTMQANTTPAVKSPSVQTPPDVIGGRNNPVDLLGASPAGGDGGAGRAHLGSAAGSPIPADLVKRMERVRVTTRASAKAHAQKEEELAAMEDLLQQQQANRAAAQTRKSEAALKAEFPAAYRARRPGSEVISDNRTESGRTPSGQGSGHGVVEEDVAEVEGAEDPALTPLTPEEEEKVLDALDETIQPRNEQLAFHKDEGAPCTRYDFASMRGGEWLNDEVINFYLRMIKDRQVRDAEAGGRLPKVWVWTTMFYKKLYSVESGSYVGKYDYKGVKRWTLPARLKARKLPAESVFDVDKIIVPLHQEVHWTVCVIDLRAKRLTFYDSMHHSDVLNALTNLKRWLSDEHQAKKGEPLDLSDWEVVERPHEHGEAVPSQLNGVDCGVFMLKMAEYQARDAKMTFSQDDMPFFRRRIVADILNGKIA
eukprot:PRCOL_00000359-RA